MEAKPSRQPSFKGESNTFLPTPSFTRQEGNPTDVWERLDWDDVSVESFLLKENKALSIQIAKKVAAVFGDGIFRLHAFPLPHSGVWSWNLLAEKKSQAQASAASTSTNIQLSETTVQLPAAAAQQEKEKVEEEEDAPSDDDLSISEVLLTESGDELQGWEKQEGSHQMKESMENLWRFPDPAAAPDGTPEEAGEKAKAKSLCRKFVSWLDDKIHDHCKRKISKTYWREQREGDEVYRRRIISILFSPALFATGANSKKVYSLCRAQRERQKRETWLRRDEWRQGVRSLLDTYWEGNREKEEARREKEEERFENRASEHNISLSDSTEGSKRRMRL